MAEQILGSYEVKQDEPVMKPKNARSLKMNTEKILIIDNSYSSILLMDDALKTAGYKTKSASCIKDAIHMIAKGKPGLIILDLNLPKISGFDFLEMRGKLNIDKIPVIVVTANDTPESVQRTKTLGASAFFPKPVQLNSVVKKVKSLIKE